MNYSRPGEFYGETNETKTFDGIILNDARYILDKVDWHYHENAYFTFLLQGGVIEGDKKGVYEYLSGDAVFHNSQEAHYNVASGLPTRGFHIDISPTWFSSVELPMSIADGNIRISDPHVRQCLYELFRDFKIGSNQLAVDAILAKIFSLLSGVGTSPHKNPEWVKKVREALHEQEDVLNLSDLAKLANVHPVHLSREFRRYFHLPLGDYIRQVRIQRALVLMADPYYTLTEIALECGFADQSHFIRSFKSICRCTPLRYRKLLLKDAAC